MSKVTFKPEYHSTHFMSLRSDISHCYMDVTTAHEQGSSCQVSFSAPKTVDDSLLINNWYQGFRVGKIFIISFVIFINFGLGDIDTCLNQTDLYSEAI